MEGALSPLARAALVALGALVAAGCDRSGAPTPDGGAAAPAARFDLAWRARLAATGLPWRVRERRSGVELLLVPPGEFLRGASPDDPEATADERPQHAVRVEEPFYLGRYEVLAAEWARVMGDWPGFFSPAAEAGEGAAAPPMGAPTGLPVEQVAYFRVQEFLAATGTELPTESQWEYAAAAGAASARYGPLDEVAWNRGNAGGRPHAAGTRCPNALGFHDLLGNVWEWTSSGFREDEYSRHRAPLDARARILATAKSVLRGGSWYDAPKRVRLTARYAVERDFVGGHVGFRVARLP